MKERVELLGISVDVLPTKEAAEQTISYMETEGSKVVYFVNSETLLLLEGHDSWKNCVEASQLVLPGAANVDNSLNEVLGYERDPFFFESYLDRILDYIVEMGMDTLLVTGTEQQFLSVQANIHEKRPLLDLTGFYKTEQDESYEHIVNEINSVAPDVLLVACDETMQLELLDQYHDLMNAGMVLFVGHQLYHKAVIDEEIPEHIDKWNLNNVYRFIRKGGHLKSTINSLKMHLRILQHKKNQENDE